MTDWSQIVQQHGALVWRTAQRLLNNEADASDCFQRTFIAALELQRTEVVRNWPALLKRLATARALDHLRQRQRESSRLTTLPEESAIDGKGVGPVQAAQASELAEHLRTGARRAGCSTGPGVLPRLPGGIELPGCRETARHQRELRRRAVAQSQIELTRTAAMPSAETR